MLLAATLLGVGFILIHYWKAIVLLFLNAVSALVMPIVQNGGSLEVDRQFLVTFVLSFILSVASYYGLTKPLGLAGSDSKVAQINNGKFALGKAA